MQSGCGDSRTAGSQTLEPTRPNLINAGSPFEELLVPQRSNQCFPILEPQVPSSRNRTHASQSWNHGPPARGTDGSHMLEPMPPHLGTTSFQLDDNSHMLELMPPNLGTTRSEFEKLAVPKRWNQCFPILEPRVPSSRN